jgi:hypothetical protein
VVWKGLQSHGFGENRSRPGFSRTGWFKFIYLLKFRKSEKTTSIMIDFAEKICLLFIDKKVDVL